ncbi:MAG: nucleotidyltransferase substrate binding protein [Candidatus Gastranaerophilales bacterium]|nr:nucleotidyltransferase substrate binding protein [Candidatus Gastranaerophilales bacterium]
MENQPSTQTSTFNLEKSYGTLLTCFEDFGKNQSSPLAEYIKDSCVKRFEYTLETAWKLMKKILIKKYGKNETELTINNIFRLMQGLGYTKNWENWRDYYQKRNATAHEYNIEKSRELIEIIPSFIKDVEFLINSIKEKENED